MSVLKLITNKQLLMMGGGMCLFGLVTVALFFSMNTDVSSTKLRTFSSRSNIISFPYKKLQNPLDIVGKGSIKIEQLQKMPDPFIYKIEKPKPPPQKVISKKPQEPLPQYKLTGIWYQKQSSTAIINGKLVEENDYIDENTRIKKINRNQVILLYKKREIKLQMED